MLRRLDAELVRRKLARSRAEAQQMIADQLVSVDGLVCDKPTRQVNESAAIKLRETGDRWVSRGARKLLGALSKFVPLGLEISDRCALDAGASTGGFTQVLLAKGARRVIAVDVGYGQLAWSLRNDERVEVMERVNIRNLQPEQLVEQPNLIVADLSFISLRTVLPALVEICAMDADLVLMVKPQFEVGRDQVGTGVVRDPALRKQAVTDVVASAQALGCGLRAVVASPLPGPEGNVEYFIWLQKGTVAIDPKEVESSVDSAILEGPS